MRFHIGDKVRVKSFKEISLTLDSGGYIEDLFFNPKMKDYCGQVFVVQSCNYRDNIQLKGVLKPGTGYGSWYWHESWLEPARKTFSDIILGEDKYEF